MNKVINYTIVGTYDLYSIIKSVQASIKDGWQPIGGVSVSSNDGAQYFAQGMVKYQEEQQ